jgi:hypothetical protein
VPRASSALSINEEWLEEQGVSHVEFQKGLLMPPCEIVWVNTKSEYTGLDIEATLHLAN